MFGDVTDDVIAKPTIDLETQNFAHVFTKDIPPDYFLILQITAFFLTLDCFLAVRTAQKRAAWVEKG